MHSCSSSVAAVPYNGRAASETEKHRLKRNLDPYYFLSQVCRPPKPIATQIKISYLFPFSSIPNSLGSMNSSGTHRTLSFVPTHLNHLGPLVSP